MKGRYERKRRGSTILAVFVVICFIFGTVILFFARGNNRTDEPSVAAGSETESTDPTVSEMTAQNHYAPIIEKYKSQYKVLSDIDENELAKNTDGCSGADIDALFRTCAVKLVYNKNKKKETNIQELINQGLTNIKESKKQKSINNFNFGQRRTRSNSLSNN